ncbi:hypothetical protein [Aneurinibacillus migulanus]|uniref:NHLP leader peptide domain-containing protein n=1 Tax=Aneurinibacillus migulanus TaxID=47500 RepID=A0A0D1VFT0_ANEMI|nr:hypothetical protein [Aneurinibacillus migulanus]KIV58349.1 hypothetical protein TS65_07200 [Aneurinibacillus migulanus]KON95918.1 hypothetical protein AF333_10915 [Aneurinibacillus migulanus]MED0893418.1 hypothetical protein [Aneurinibacillus migulanus]MED1616036.1 hypothetical protein [Aneurinibacillus migulanus]SDJ16761.1 hypothetical protein SAMN04487909_1139 [Aneurinibacillus migulanus]
MDWNIEKLNQAVKQFQEKSSVDSEFRKLALENPSSAVKQLTGLEIPEGFKLQVVDNAGAHLTVVLPDLKADEYESTMKYPYRFAVTKPLACFHNDKLPANCIIFKQKSRLLATYLYTSNLIN